MKLNKIYKNLLSLVFGLFFLSACSQKNSEKQQAEHTAISVSAEEFKKILAETPNAQIVDIRTPEEFNSGTIKSAVNINYNDDDFKEKIQKLDKKSPLLFFCHSGGRSGNAFNLLKNLGFEKIVEMKSGLLGWRNAGYEIALANKNNSEKNAEEYTSQLLNNEINSSEMVLIDYYAKWCKPCIKMQPILDKLEKEYSGKVKIIRIDTDQSSALVKEKQINTIPYLEFYRNGKLEKTASKGMEEEAFRKWFDIK